MTEIDRQRFASMAEAYDAMAPYLLPQYAFLQEEMLRLAELDALAHPIVVDLGAGSGRFLERVLERNARATCYWMDSSHDFCGVARRRLARFDERVVFIESALEDAWEADVDGPVHAIFSMSAIHHLESDDKRRLYRRCFDLLVPGGWFVNTDEMQTMYRDAYLASLHHWVRHVDDSREVIPADLLESYEQWQGHFDRWKKRNIEQADAPKTKGDDLHEGFIEQMTWLSQIGFENVDVFVKHHLWCSVGGRKPA